MVFIRLQWAGKVKILASNWQEYTEELYKKDPHDPDNHDGVSTHLEPDILECEVKWALESISTNKASGGDGISAELFQILEDSLQAINAGEGVEKREPSYTIGGNAN